MTQITCPVCGGHGELPAGPRPIDPAMAEFRPCWMCNGREVVDQAEVDRYDAHIKAVLGEGWF